MNAGRHQGTAFVGSGATLATVALLLGCSAHSPSVPGTASGKAMGGSAPGCAVAQSEPATELERLRRAEHYEVGVGPELRAYELRQELDAAWEEGQALWLTGDSDAAFDAFDRGVQTVLTSDLDLEAHPELRQRVDVVLNGIHQLAVEDSLENEKELPEDGAPALPDLEAEVQRQHLAQASPSQPPAHAVPASTAPTWLAKATGTYTIPMRENPAVDAMVRFYTEKRKDQLELGFERIGRYGPTIARILEQEDLPADLLWLSIVESNANPHAYSRAHARGLWQFIPGTGRRYGLNLDYWVDERADFEKATRSSARYLKDLHDRFGDWHLALAAYNAGEGKVGGGIRRTGRSDYWYLRRTRYLRSETKSYVPALLAVMRIARDPAAHGLRFEPAPPLEWETASVAACADLSVLADCAGTTAETLRALNPELRRGCTPGDADRYELRVPPGSKHDFEERFSRLPPEKRLSWARHRVHRGETLTGIAQRYGSSVSAIMAANRLRSANRIGVGWSLLIPRGDAAQALPAAVVAAKMPGSGRSDRAIDPAPSSAGGTARMAAITTRPAGTTTRYHRVRPGDTLERIARSHSTSVKAIQQLNGIRNANRIRPGQRLLISALTAAASSTEPIHTVRRGDTLSSIARANGTTVARLREWNDLPSRGYIHPGQELAVRADAKLTYSVRRGDTLSHIARTHRTTVAELREWNDLSRSGLIHPGDRLTIFRP